MIFTDEKKKLMDKLTDGPKDGPTNIPFDRDAWRHLKTSFSSSPPHSFPSYSTQTSELNYGEIINKDGTNGKRESPFKKKE